MPRDKSTTWFRGLSKYKMIYPPESTWNDYPTLGQVLAITRLSKLLNRDPVIPGTRWQARNMIYRELKPALRLKRENAVKVR